MINDEGEIEITLNEKQSHCDYWLANIAPLGEKKHVGVLGGRGGGKSTLGTVILWNMKNEMPKARGQWAFSAVSKFKRAVMPGIKANLWELYGERPYDFNSKKGDYVLFREPPKEWDRPYQTPDDWSNCVSWENGFVIEICGYTQDPDAVRSRNDDFAIIEEALKFKEEYLPALIPCVRANIGKFQSRYHWAIIYLSTPPYATQGQWMYKWEQEAKVDPKHYYFTFIKTADNQAFLPPDYIEGLRKTLLKIQFKVEVEGYRITRPEKVFYPAFSREKHAPDDIEQEQSYYYSPYLPLVASIDFNAGFTSCTMWQHSEDLEHRNSKALFVREPDDNISMTQTLARLFVSTYVHHPVKQIVLTGDRNGANKSAQVKFIDGRWVTPYIEFSDELEAAGWEVIISPVTYNPEGFDKFQMMHDIFSEKENAFMQMRFDPEGALPTIISIENTPINPDYSKNKKSETDGSDQELATHLSDTVDYYAEYVRTGGVSFSTGGFELKLM
jgi:hypothetical protein